MPICGSRKRCWQPRFVVGGQIRSSFGRAPRHWKTPATPDPNSAGRVRARVDWDHVLQRAIAQAARYHGFYHDILRTCWRHSGRDADGGLPSYTSWCVIVSPTCLRWRLEPIEHRLSIAQAVFLAFRRAACAITLRMVSPQSRRCPGISINTARTHLKRLYERPALTQAALVRILKRRLAASHAPLVASMKVFRCGCAIPPEAAAIDVLVGSTARVCQNTNSPPVSRSGHSLVS
jgi:hypothetical protein